MSPEVFPRRRVIPVCCLHDLQAAQARFSGAVGLGGGAPESCPLERSAVDHWTSHSTCPGAHIPQVWRRGAAPDRLPKILLVLFHLTTCPSPRRWMRRTSWPLWILVPDPDVAASSRPRLQSLGPSCERLTWPLQPSVLAAPRTSSLTPSVVISQTPACCSSPCPHHFLHVLFITALPIYNLPFSFFICCVSKPWHVQAKGLQLSWRAERQTWALCLLRGGTPLGRSSARVKQSSPWWCLPPLKS